MFNSRKYVAFLVSLSSRSTQIHFGRKKNLTNRFLYKKEFSFYDDNVTQLRQLTKKCDKPNYLSNNSSVQNNF